MVNEKDNNENERSENVIDSKKQSLGIDNSPAPKQLKGLFSIQNLRDMKEEDFEKLKEKLFPD